MPVRLSHLKKMEGLETAHCEIASKPDQAYAYCTKDDETTIPGSRFEWGQRKSQGQRTDLASVKRLLDEGAPMREIAESHFSQFIRYEKGLTSYMRLVQKARDFKTVVIMLIGPSMTGKSTTARILSRYLGSVYAVPQPKNSGLYFDGYDGQDVMFFDEFNGHFMKPEFFNHLADAGALLLPTHGSAGQQMRSKYIILCTNYHPRYWWRNRNDSQVFQTTRRIDATIRMFRKGPSPYEKPDKTLVWPIFAGNHPMFNPGSPQSIPVAPTLLVQSPDVPEPSPEAPAPHWEQQAQDPIEWMDDSDFDNY